MNSSKTVEPCRIIGVLDNGIHGLTHDAIQHIEQADVVIGGTRVLQLFETHYTPHAMRLDLTKQLGKVPEWIRQAQSDGLRVVVLATGDPLCNGIASYLIARLCIDAFEIIPNVSTMQLACARLGLPWQDLKIVSAHTKDAGEWSRTEGLAHGLYPVLRAATQFSQLAIFTSPENSPDRIARMLVAEGLAEEFQAAVAVRLLQEDERVYQGLSLREIAEHRFDDPNMLVLWRHAALKREPVFGYADDRFAQRQPEKGLITKREARAVSLARLQLTTDSIVWDIGAGSGSVGIEAARIARDGYVFAIEKNADDVANAQENQKRFGVHNYTIEHAKAPTGLDRWADPDAIFIGGSGGELEELIRLSISRLKPNGHLVMNFVTFENLSVAISALKALDVEWDVTQLQASRSKPILDMHRMSAENPVWIVTAQNKESSSEANRE